MESQAPPRPDHHTSAGQQPPPEPRSGVRRFTLPIALAITFVALYVIAVCTPFGQAVEDSLLRGYSNEAWLNAMDHSFRPPPLQGEELTFFVGVALIALFAVRGRRWWLAAAGVFVPVATAAATFILNRYALLRPNFLGEPGAVVETSFPSGHVAITAGVVVGAILISGPRTRRYVMAVGVFWLAFIAAAVQNLGWHRASDAIGATLLACISYAVAVRLMPKATRPAAATQPLGPAPVLVIAAVGAILGGGRSGYVLEGIPFALIGVVCALVVWFTVARTTRAVVVITAVTLVLALVSSGGIQYWRDHSPVNVVAGPEPMMSIGPGTPGKGITYGQAGAKARIDIYFWFDDAGAARFEKANGKTLEALIQDGSATVTYWPLDPNDSLPKVSDLFAVAAANGKGRGFLRTYFNDFAKTWTDGQLIQLGDRLGVPQGKFAADLTLSSYATWLTTIADESTKHRLFFSPSILVNGKLLDTGKVTPALLTSAIGR